MAMKMQYKIFNGLGIQIDSEDYLLINQALKPGCEWYFNKKNKQVKGWCILNGITQKIILSRLLMEVVNSSEIEDIDHKDGNVLNFSKDNLRPCTHQQNCFNTGKYIVDKGIRWREDRQCWVARIRIHGDRRIHLGHFKDKEEARTAYNNAVKQYHGEFGVLSKGQNGSN